MSDRPETERLPVIAGPRRAGEQAGGSQDARFSAHVQGQTGQRRGLRGGRPVLETARGSYLKTEWAGSQDRRSSPGQLRRVSV